MANLNKRTLESLKKDEALIMKIATAMGKKFRTVESWVRDNDARLTVPAVLMILSKEMNVTEISLTAVEIEEPISA